MPKLGDITNTSEKAAKRREYQRERMKLWQRAKRAAKKAPPEPLTAMEKDQQEVLETFDAWWDQFQKKTSK